MDDLVATATANEEQVVALNGFNVKLTEEDLQKWTRAYKENKSHITMYTKLPQGQKHGDFHLSPSWLMDKMVGGQ